MPRLLLHPLAALPSVVLVGFIASVGVHASEVRTVVLAELDEFNPAPGRPVESEFEFVRAGVLNNRGEVAFYAQVDGGEDFHERGYWLASRDGTISQIVVEDTLVTTTGTERVLSGNFDDFAFNDQGNAAFSVRSSSTGPTPTGGDSIWVFDSASQLQLIALEDRHAPGTDSSVVFSSLPTNPIEPAFDGLRLSHNGSVAFRGRLAGPEVEDLDNTGLWATNAMGGLQPIARTGGAVPGPTGGSKLAYVSAPALNDLGMVAFSGRMDNSQREVLQEHGIWLSDPDNGLINVVYDGDLAPHVTSDLGFGSISFSSFGDGSVTINDAAHVAFSAFLTGSGVNAENNHSVWTWSANEGLDPVAREGDQAPGMAKDVVFSDYFVLDLKAELFKQVLLNEHGRAAFSGSVYGPGITNVNDQGLWAQDENGELKLVVLEGQLAPGTEHGEVFDEIFSFSMNSAGQIAFLAGLRGEGVTNQNSRGIWATNLQGELQLIARAGDWLNFYSGGELQSRQMLSVNFSRGSGGEEGLSDSFNDKGQILFSTGFVNAVGGADSGVFVSNRVAIPEPRSLFLAIAAAAVACGRRRVC